jgi:hypothetical protein
VGARAGEQHLGVSGLVDQQPIRLDVALAPALPFAFEGVITSGCWEMPICAKCVEDVREKGEIVAAASDTSSG